MSATKHHHHDTIEAGMRFIEPEEKDAKFKHLVQEIVDSEFEQYSWFEPSEIGFQQIHDGFEYWILNIRTKGQAIETYAAFKTDGTDVWVRIGEDFWEPVRTYDTTIKHFWMAVLKWPE